MPANHKDQVHDFCVVWCLFQTEILTHFPLRNDKTDDEDFLKWKLTINKIKNCQLGTMNQLAPNIPTSKIIFVGSEKTHM